MKWDFIARIRKHEHQSQVARWRKDKDDWTNTDRDQEQEGGSHYILTPKGPSSFFGVKNHSKLRLLLLSPKKTKEIYFWNLSIGSYI